MLCATFRLTCYASLAISLPASLAAGAQAGSAVPAVKSKTITFSEGTDMAATISPDHKTILMDLQGLLYSMPMASGKTKQISAPYEEDSHPVWSSKGSIVADGRGSSLCAKRQGDRIRYGRPSVHDAGRRERQTFRRSGQTYQ